MAETNHADRRLSELREFVPAVDRDLQRTFAFTVESVRASGNPDKKGTYYVRGLAAVYDTWSLDLGGFRERISPGAFDNVLSRDPHVLHLIDHDTSKVLSSTRTKTLKLSAKDDGLHYDSEVDSRRSYASDLLVNLETGLVDQSSFAFTVERDEWRIADGGEIVERQILEVKDLYDVTTCAMGAYPATSADLAVRTLAARRPRVGEARADMPSLQLLTDMYETGQQYLELESDPEDAPDRDRMSGVLEELEGMIEDEAGEDPAGVPARKFRPPTLGATTLAAPTRVDEQKDVAPASELAGTPRASDKDAKRVSPEQREAQERAFELWRGRLLAEHRRTREFAFGVKPEKGQET